MPYQTLIILQSANNNLMIRLGKTLVKLEGSAELRCIQSKKQYNSQVKIQYDPNAFPSIRWAQLSALSHPLNSKAVAYSAGHFYSILASAAKQIFLAFAAQSQAIQFCSKFEDKDNSLISFLAVLAFVRTRWTHNQSNYFESLIEKIKALREASEQQKCPSLRDRDWSSAIEIIHEYAQQGLSERAVSIYGNIQQNSYDIAKIIGAIELKLQRQQSKGQLPSEERQYHLSSANQQRTKQKEQDYVRSSLLGEKDQLSNGLDKWRCDAFLIYNRDDSTRSHLYGKSSHQLKDFQFLIPK